MPVFHRRLFATAIPFVLFACVTSENKTASNAAKTAIVKNCTTYAQSVLCKLIAAWNTEQPPANRREQFASLVSRTVPAESTNPIAQCLALARAYDKASATMALHDCLGGVKPDLSNAGDLGGGGDLDAALGLNGSLRPTGPKTGGGKACGTNGGHINPWLAQTSGGWNFGNWPHSSVAPPDERQHFEDNKLDREYQRLEREATQKWQRYAEALEKEADVDYKKSKGQATQAELDAAKAETKKALDDANQAIEKRDTYKKALVEGNDAVTPEDDGTAVARTVEGFEDPCAAFNDFLKGCAAAGWKTGPCKQFLDKLKGCKSTIMLVDPDQGSGCADVPTTIDKATFDNIMTKVCWQRIKPAGPDENPCAPASVKGATVVVMQPNPCTDPRAHVDPGSGACDAPFTDPQKATDALLNRPKLADIIATMEKLCGCGLPPISPRDGGGDPRAQPTYQAVAWSAEPAFRPFP